MDCRCPRELEETPDTWCHLAVLRLKAIRTAGKELSEEEEASLPGCPWAINHQLANYCFFKYAEEYAPDKPLADVEIAALNCISVDTVKKTEKSALAKIKNTEEFTSLKKAIGDESIVSEKPGEEDYKIYR
jgi:hypothetical protein